MTDHKPLITVFDKIKQEAAMETFINSYSLNEFQAIHKTGKKDTNAIALSPCSDLYPLRQRK